MRIFLWDTGHTTAHTRPRATRHMHIADHARCSLEGISKPPASGQLSAPLRLVLALSLSLGKGQTREGLSLTQGSLSSPLHLPNTQVTHILTALSLKELVDVARVSMTMASRVIAHTISRLAPDGLLAAALAVAGAAAGAEGFSTGSLSPPRPSWPEGNLSARSPSLEKAARVGLPATSQKNETMRAPHCDMRCEMRWRRYSWSDVRCALVLRVKVRFGGASVLSHRGGEKAPRRVSQRARLGHEPRSASDVSGVLAGAAGRGVLIGPRVGRVVHEEPPLYAVRAEPGLEPSQVGVRLAAVAASGRAGQHGARGHLGVEAEQGGLLALDHDLV